MRVICYGDSNTYGYEPGAYIGGRYTKDVRWVDLLAKKTGWNIENEGLNGREIPGRSIYVSDDVDLLIVMLGTNDLLQGAGVDAVTARMEAFLNGINIANEKILLIAPPPMKLGLWVPESSLIDKSNELAASYQALAGRIGVRFADAGKWNISLTFDGIHFTEEDNNSFAEGLYKALV